MPRKDQKAHDAVIKHPNAVDGCVSDSRFWVFRDQDSAGDVRSRILLMVGRDQEQFEKIQILG